MKKEIIYLDNGSTTKTYKDVVKLMNEIHLNNYGNPSSEHMLGEKSKKIIEESKKILSKEINCKPWEIIFTSGATESNNLSLKGLALAYPYKRKIIISSIEHSSVYEEAMYLKSKGYEITEVPVDHNGIIDIIYLENQIDESTLLVSIMHVNNEIGTIQDISAIGEICRAKGVFFHTDCVQSFEKLKIDVQNMKIDLLSASAHKIGGPKGVGLIYVREGIEIKPIIMGGGQEKGLRAGTQNVAGIAGFAKALQISKNSDKDKIKKLRDYMLIELEKIGGVLNGHREKRIYNNINISFKGNDANTIVFALSEKGIMCSTKSACLSKNEEENRVLQSLMKERKEIEGSFRIVIGEFNSKKEIDKTISELKKFL